MAIRSAKRLYCRLPPKYDPSLHSAVDVQKNLAWTDFGHGMNLFFTSLTTPLTPGPSLSLAFVAIPPPSTGTANTGRVTAVVRHSASCVDRNLHSHLTMFQLNALEARWWLELPDSALQLAQRRSLDLGVLRKKGPP